jgi:hypothetical protein
VPGGTERHTISATPVAPRQSVDTVKHERTDQAPGAEALCHTGEASGEGCAIVGGNLVSYRVDAVHCNAAGNAPKLTVLDVAWWENGRWTRARTTADRLWATPGDAWLNEALCLEGSIENAIEAIAKIEPDLQSYREQLAHAQSEALRLLGTRVLGGGNLPE